MDRTDDESTSSDRSLPWRTLAAALLGGLAGAAMAYGVTCVLAGIAAPAVTRYLRAVHLDQVAGTLPICFGPGGQPLVPPVALWVATALSGVLLPFLFNRRWFSRRIFHLAGLGKLLLAFVLLAVVGILVGAAVDPAGARISPGAPDAAADFMKTWGWLVRAGLAGVGMGLFFLLAGERTLGGALDRWRNPDLGAGGAFAALAVGFVIGTGLGLTGVWMSRVVGTFTQALYGFLGESPEPSRLGWSRVHLGYSLALGLFFAALGAVPVALGPSPAPRGRRWAAIFIALLPLAAIFGVGTWFQRYAMYQGEMRFPSLTAVADLEPVPRPRLLALPTEQGARAFVYSLDAVTYGSITDERVAATPGNVTKIQAYLDQRRGRWSMHTAKAWTAIPSIHDRLFQLDEAVAAHAAVAESPGFIINAQLLAVRLQHMPPTPAVREAAQRLLDPTRFAASGTAKARLSAVALNLGDLEQAKRLWQEALAEGHRPDAAIPEPKAVPVRDRSLAGVLRLGDKPAGGVRVVLYRAMTPFKLEAVPNAIRALAATTTDGEGRFSFEGLDARSYHFGVLLPAELGSTPADVMIAGNLGPFDLAAGELRVETGPITVTRK